MPTSVSCKKCGAGLRDGARFCSACGLNVTGEDVSGVTRMIRELDSEPDRQLELLRRSTIGEYDILEELGQGGMARVYLAHDISLDRKVAIKVMAPELKERTDMAQRFVLEARTAARLSHPNIIPIYAVHESDRLLYFVMKCVQGRPLDEIIADDDLSPGVAVDVITQVASGLEYAHRNGVVHRDIKPANIIIDSDGWAIVTDFGIAKVSQSAGLTMTGATIGTPSYMSPEQCSGGEITGLSDQYSLGMVAYEMLAGELPFSTSESIVQIVWSHFNERPRDLRELRPDCPDDVHNAVMRMIEKQPSDRWPSLGELIGTISEFAQPADTGPGGDVAGPPRLSRFRTPRSPIPALKPAPEGDVVTALSITPPVASLVVGHELQLAVSAVDAAGRDVRGAEVHWDSGDKRVVDVNDDGLVAGVGEGETTVTARCGDLSARVGVSVKPVPVVAVEIYGDSEVVAGESFTLSARLFDADGNELNRPVRWLATDPDFARFSDDGSILALKPGCVDIIASSGDAHSTHRVSILPIPVDSVVLFPLKKSLAVGETGTVEYEIKGGGYSLRDRKVAWISDNHNVIEVTGDGTVRAVAPGAANVSARCEGLEASVSVEVTAPRVAAVALHPAFGTIAGNETVRLTVTAVTASGEGLSTENLRWSSSNPKVVQVSQTGVCQALKVGAAIIRVDADGHSATCRLNVTRVGVAEIRLGGPRSLEAGSSLELEATAHDSLGQRLPGRVIEWMSSDPAVVRVDAKGEVTGVGAGVAEITAASGIARESVRVRVVEPTVRLLRVEPGDLQMRVGAQMQMHAVAVTTGGSELEVNAEMWRSSNPGVVRVTDDGIVAALRPGVARIAVQANGKRAVTSIYVQARS